MAPPPPPFVCKKHPYYTNEAHSKGMNSSWAARSFFKRNIQTTNCSTFRKSGLKKLKIIRKCYKNDIWIMKKLQIKTSKIILSFLCKIGWKILKYSAENAPFFSIIDSEPILCHTIKKILLWRLAKRHLSIFYWP